MQGLSQLLASEKDNDKTMKATITLVGHWGTILELSEQIRRELSLEGLKEETVKVETLKLRLGKVCLLSCLASLNH